MTNNKMALFPHHQFQRLLGTYVKYKRLLDFHFSIQISDIVEYSNDEGTVLRRSTRNYFEFFDMDGNRILTWSDDNTL